MKTLLAILSGILIGLVIAVICLITDPGRMPKGTPEAMHFPPAELATIRTAAIRNGIQPGTENWYILLAIRKSENGKPGLEFGIMNPKANDLDSQAGWAAASIIGARKRWDGKGDFVDAMGARYCPPEDHPLNKHWAGNVRAWAKKLGGVK